MAWRGERWVKFLRGNRSILKRSLYHNFSLYFEL